MKEESELDFTKEKVESVLIKLVISELIEDGLIQYHTLRNIKQKVLFEILLKDGIKPGEATKFIADKFNMDVGTVRNVIYSKKIRSTKECYRPNKVAK